MDNFEQGRLVLLDEELFVVLFMDGELVYLATLKEYETEEVSILGFASTKRFLEENAVILPNNRVVKFLYA